MQGVIYSFLSSVPVAKLHINVIDCENHGNSVSAFYEVKRKMPELFKKHGYIVQMGYILFDKETTYQELVENYKFMLDLVEILNNCIWQDEVEELKNNISEEEIMLLKYYLDNKGNDNPSNTGWENKFKELLDKW